MNETRAPADDTIRQKVLANYKSGIKPKKLAEETGISINTIKSWISREKKKDAEKAAVKKSASKKKKDAPGTGKRGAPPGNQNAKGGRGGGAPFRNRNAEKHGAFSKIYYDAIDNDELSMIASMENDEESQLEFQLQLFTIRERRLMQRIKQYKDMEEVSKGLGVSSVSKAKETHMRLDVDGRPVLDADQKPLYDTVSEKTLTHTATIMSSIMTLEAELTKAQRAKTKAIDSLAKLRNERRKLEIEEAREQREADLHDLQKEYLDAQIEHMDASTNKLLGTDNELEDTSDTDAMIYGADTGGAADEE